MKSQYKGQNRFKSSIKALVVMSLLFIPAVMHGFDEIGKPASSMAPMNEPEKRPVGSKYFFQDNLDGGSEKYSTLTVREGELVTFEDSAGSMYTRDSWFAPSMTWENCDGNSGSQTPKLKRDIWPLSKGTKFKYNVKNGSSSNENNWSDYVTCRVKTEVRVRTVSGEFDTYKLVCAGKWTTRIRYVSPEAGTTVAYQRIHKNRGKQSDTEWIRFE
ncbi:MAG: hypothetical protein ACI8P9_005213 [Parasphingorhabdus sp.]|jgi:hypothetical protein